MYLINLLIDWLDKRALRQTSWKVFPEFHLEKYQRFSEFDFDLDEILGIYKAC